MNHIPVLLQESVSCLDIDPSGVYIDGTFGCGGHSLFILSKLNYKGKLISFDKDLLSVMIGRSITDRRFMIIHDSFSNIIKYVTKLDLLGKVNGVLLDLGVSNMQLSDSKRGFSFTKDGPLDMRMNTTKGILAFEWLNSASLNNIFKVLKLLGEEKFAWKISKEIIRRRNMGQNIFRTSELSNLSCSLIPFRRKIHPATKVFQAIRMYINNELQEINVFFNNILDILCCGGRLSVISFNSLEDRIVKRFINTFSKDTLFRNHYFPLTEEEIYKKYFNSFKLTLAGKIFPKFTEVKSNPRSRSAVLRFAEKSIMFYNNK